MAQLDGPPTEPPPTTKQRLKRWFGRQSNAGSSVATETSQQPQSVTEAVSENDQQQSDEADKALKSKPRTRVSRSVVPGLPRAKTFDRQLSEERSHLLPVEPTPDERRAVSMDRRSRSHVRMAPLAGPDPRTSAPGVLSAFPQASSQKFVPDEAIHLSDEEPAPSQHDDYLQGTGVQFEHADELHGDFSDAHSILTTQSQYEFDELIHQELETTWILNLSMRYKDHSNREKFFVTYREQREPDDVWRRVTVTLDYRQAPEGSLEKEIACTKYQRSKSAKIYEAIRESLREIQFYESVTNLKLETINERLHVHVVEDSNEIIHYPHVSQVAHLGCRRIREQDIVFDHHMSGFVYKVGVHGQVLIKKEIPGPDTIEEFLYEVNALNSVGYSDHVIDFYGLVVDEHDELVKGLLISFADGGALIDVIYDNCKAKNARGLEWSVRERWARQIVNGLADIHESGFVQGDFTLSNIVIDDHDDAKIIDVNRRGCPVGWEPPEATPLIESHHRISMYIGVKSDLFQLGMVLWALAMEEDEPEREGRPLTLGPDDNIPDWYRTITELCLNPDPRKRLHASMLLTLIPEELELEHHLSIQDSESLPHHQSTNVGSEVSPMRSNSLSQSLAASGHLYTRADPPLYQSWHYAPRGRSPPSPLPSNFDDGCESPNRFHSRSAWAENRNIRPSYSDVGADELHLRNVTQQLTPSASAELKSLLIGRELDDLSQRPRSMERLRPVDWALDAGNDNTLELETEPSTVPSLLVVEPPVDDHPTKDVEAAGYVFQKSAAFEEISPNIQRLEEVSGVSKPVRDPLANESSGPEKATIGNSADDETPRAEATAGEAEEIPSAPLEPVQAISEDVTSLDIVDDPALTAAEKPIQSQVVLEAEENPTDGHENAQTGHERVQSEPQSKNALQEDFVVVEDVANEKPSTEHEGKQQAAPQADLLDLHKPEEEQDPSAGEASEKPEIQIPLIDEAGAPEKADPVPSQLVPEEALPDEPIREGDIVTSEDKSEAIPSDTTPGTNDQAQAENIVTPDVNTTEPEKDLPSTELKGEMGEGKEGIDTSCSIPEAPLVDEGDRRQTVSATTAQASTIAGASWSDTQDQFQAMDQDLSHMGPSADYSFTSGLSSGGKQDAVGWAGSLAGIGAGHLDFNDDLLRGAEINDEDFQCLAQTETPQALMITTDSKS